MDFETFARPLRGRTPKQIRELARSEFHELVAAQDRELMIRELYELKFKVGAPAQVAPLVATPSADVSAAPAAGAPTPDFMTIQAVNTHYRCGRQWVQRVKTRVAITDFTSEQWRTLEADKQLRIR